VNHSPEPFSNVALSLIEDMLVVFGSYVAVQYPYVMLIIVVLFVGAFLWFAPKAFRLLRIEMNAILALLKKLFLKVKGLFVRKGVVVASSESHRSTLQSSSTRKLDEIASDEMPIEYVYHLRDAFNVRDHAAVIKCAAGKGVRGLRHSIGYLNITSTEAIFMCKRLLRLRNYTVPRDKIEHVHFKKRLLMDHLTLTVGGKQHVFYLFKDVSNRGEVISRVLSINETENQQSGNRPANPGQATGPVSKRDRMVPRVMPQR
jgi:hypothetical protein